MQDRIIEINVICEIIRFCLGVSETMNSPQEPCVHEADSGVLVQNPSNIADSDEERELTGTGREGLLRLTDIGSGVTPRTPRQGRMISLSVNR